MYCSFRIGTERCAKEHSHYGITTIKKEHITINDKNVIINFIGKKGVKNVCTISKIDKKTKDIAELIEKLYNSKKDNQYIFSTKNEHITFLDVNNFLKQYGKITSKSFRTLNANITLIESLSLNDFKIKKKGARKKQLNKIIEEIVSVKLHHTKAICKKSYLLKEIMDMFIEHPLKLKKKLKIEEPRNSRIEFLNFLRWMSK